MDPGKVYLARKKYVKRQEKGTAQPPTKLPKFLLRQNKVTQFGFLCWWIRLQVPIKQFLLTQDFLHSLPSHIYHLLPSFLPIHISIPPNSQNFKMQENWKWLGARKPWRRLEWKHGEQFARNWACPLSLRMHLCQHFSSKVPLWSTFPSHPSFIWFALLSSLEACEQESFKINLTYSNPKGHSV